MDLPSCPVCGETLHLEEPRGPARCESCGFLTPVELDVVSLGNLLEEARERGLGATPVLAHSRESPEPRLNARAPPSMLESARVPTLPTLAPPPVPRELEARAPPPLEDPRAKLDAHKGGASKTVLSETRAERERARRAQLRARGELLK